MAFIKPSDTFKTKKILNPNNTSNRNAGAGAGDSSKVTAPRFDSIAGDPITPFGGEDGNGSGESGGGGSGSGGGTGGTAGTGTGQTVLPPGPGQRNLTEEFDLGEFIANALQGGSSFGSEEFNALLLKLQNEEAARFEQRGADIETDVASRGLSASTIPVGFTEQARDRREVRLQAGEASLLDRKASADDQHLFQVLESANIFLAGQNRTDAQRRLDEQFFLEMKNANTQADKDRILEKYRIDNA